MPPADDVPEVEDEDELYGLAADDFTAARNALVKRLKKAGEKERAAAAGKLRRPSLTAWALNQVARRDPDLVAEVFAAGEGLREAMDAAVAGDASAVRSAQAAERDAVDAAVAAALAHLVSAGSPGGEDARWRMSQTLRAALVDEGSAGLLRAGTMDVDIEASGFGTFGFGDVISAPGRAKKKAAAPAAPPVATAATKATKAREEAGEEAEPVGGPRPAGGRRRGGRRGRGRRGRRGSSGGGGPPGRPRPGRDVGGRRPAVGRGRGPAPGRGRRRDRPRRRGT